MEQLLRNEIDRIQRNCHLSGTPDMFPIADAARLVPDGTSLGPTYRRSPNGGTCFNGPEDSAIYMFQVRTPRGLQFLHVSTDRAYVE